ncbi:GFA family protein [Sphingomonas adhaesiva]|uniref:GFA family protein n=1 Tax=Sphingomonas adhaesiva TaxID=28212 RepID=UPI003FA74324
MLETRCHCGRVSIVVPKRPRVLTACNCSLCRRIQPLFAYYKAMSVEVHGGADDYEGYAWGRRVLRWHRCKSCGCFTHHEPQHRRPDGTSRLGVNLALVADSDRLARVAVNLRDGASDTWEVIDRYRVGMLPRH